MKSRSIPLAALAAFLVASTTDALAYERGDVLLHYADPVEPARRRGFRSPIGEWEKRRITLDSDLRLGELTAIRLGANPKGTQCTLWVRNVKVVRPVE